MMVILPIVVPRMKFVGERSTSSRTRSGRVAAQAAAKRESNPFNEMIFDSREHYERSKQIFNREILHKRVINFENQGPDFMHERIEELGWLFMYNDLVDINLDIMREFYSNFSKADQSTVYLRGKQIPISENAIHYFLGINGDSVPKVEDTYKRNLTEKRAGRLNMHIVLSTITAPGMRWDAYNPKLDRVDNGILTTNAQGWLKMIVCNLQPLRHETTFSIETALLLYTLMSNGHIHLGRILNKSMYQATSGAKDKRLAFPVMITKMAAAQGVPTYPEDRTITIPRKEKLCPFGDWQKAKKKTRKVDLPQANPPPIPPPIHEPQDQPRTSSATVAPPALTEAPSCTSTMGDLPRITLKQMGGASMALENQPVRFP
ncbi:hypothetical protein PIB30_097038 [Stylosanthes scabra]|uniref:Putative plant transposon protein domain-containing protein n=1 Tax=Stylosanthes scabra TaxID=79078 RepID=A0ABU6YUE1_9FABA|nr:hypothetical protein [Stylosanthes scabra]